MPVEMNYCMQCGTKLHLKDHPDEGPTPYCDTCGDYRYPVFNTAVSMVVLNPDHTKVILIQQYGKPYNVLVAGYVNKGEDAEDAAVREVKEELGMDAREVHFNHSHYYAPSNTLMLNFSVVVDEVEPHPNWEVDGWRWFSVEDARKAVKPNSLAQRLLNGYFDGFYDLKNV